MEFNDRRRKTHRKNKIVPRNLKRWKAWKKHREFTKVLKNHGTSRTERNKEIQGATRALQRDDLVTFSAYLQKLLWMPGEPCHPPFPVKLLRGFENLGQFGPLDPDKMKLQFRQRMKLWLTYDNNTQTDAEKLRGEYWDGLKIY